MILRFVPYIGAIISAIFPLVLAASVGTGRAMVLWTAALFFIVEPILGQAIEPLVFGHRTGLSPVSVIVSATFWTWLWGPIGLVLATPLTVCMVVLGRHVDRGIRRAYRIGRDILALCHEAAGVIVQGRLPPRPSVPA
jgi:predicted PurR-regulated permease PerM